LGERSVEAMFKGKRNAARNKQHHFLRVSHGTTKFLFADAALPAFLGTVLAILTILAGVARISTSARRCGSIEWNLIDEKNRQQKLRDGNEEP